jgi:hypothetical protein
VFVSKKPSLRKTSATEMKSFGQRPTSSPVTAAAGFSSDSELGSGRYRPTSPAFSDRPQRRAPSNPGPILQNALSAEMFLDHFFYLFLNYYPISAGFDLTTQNSAC